MVDQLDAAVGPVVDKRRDVAKKSDGKDVRLAFSQPFCVGFSIGAVTELFLNVSFACKLRSTDFLNGQTNV